MARTQKFPEDLLLEAVVKYAETEKGKIKATELAAWAALNIRGLEGVRDYHFMRPIREMDSRTGKQTLIKKSCTLRMEEINRARSLTESVKRNVQKCPPEGIHDRSVYGSAGLYKAPPDR